MLFGKITNWINRGGNKGYGFITVRHESGELDKFFVLGSRLLFEKEPEPGDTVTFDISDDKPRHENGYPLAANVRLVKDGGK